MNEKLNLLLRYFNNKYSRNDYLNFKELLTDESPELELLMQEHWDQFDFESHSPQKDLSEVQYYITRKTEQKNKVSALKKIFITYSRIAAVLLVPLLIAFIYFYSQQNSIYSKNVFVDVMSPTGARTSLNLPDGTMVWLNGDSHIRYPLTFGKNREVKIEGEAFFKVKSDKAHPFLVKARNIEVKATGTEFNVFAYNDTPEIKVILKEGQISVRNNSGSFIKKMKSGYQLRYQENSSSIQYSTINADNYSGWISGRLIFNHATFAEVVERLERWYGVDIVIEDNELLLLHFKATFISESIEEAFKLLQSTATFNFKFAKRETLPDGSLKRPKIFITKK